MWDPEDFRRAHAAVKTYLAARELWNCHQAALLRMKAESPAEYADLRRWCAGDLKTKIPGPAE